ncbi:MAG: YIP1 family protein [Thermodesulfobacteriota bacterium]
MEIICPQCGFGREVAGSKLPPKAVFATCPKCRFKFRFRALEEPEYEFEAGEDEPAAAPAPPQEPAAPALAEEAPPEPPQRPAPAAPPPPPESPAPDQPDTRPVRRIVLRDEHPEEPAPDRGQDQESDRTPSGPARSGDIWQKLENLAREENRRAESEDDPGAPGWAGRPSAVPWENLAEHGFFRGLWATVKGAAFSPVQFFRAMPATGGMSRPMSFYILLSVLSFALQTVWNALLFDALNQRFQFPPEVAEHFQVNLGQSLLAVAVVVPALSILYIFVFSSIMHLALRTMNSAGGGLEGTMRAMAYTNAVGVFSLIPFLGPLVGMFWWMTIYLIALKEIHRATYGRVLLAIHLPLVVVILAAVVAFNLPGGGA